MNTSEIIKNLRREAEYRKENGYSPIGWFYAEGKRYRGEVEAVGVDTEGTLIVSTVNCDSDCCYHVSHERTEETTVKFFAFQRALREIY